MKTPSPSLHIGGGGVVAPKAEVELKAPKTGLNLGLNAPKAGVDVRAPKTDLNLNLGLKAPSASASAAAGAGAGVAVEMRAPPVGAELSAPGISAPRVDLGAGVGVGTDLNLGADDKRLSLQRMGAVATPIAALGGGVQLRANNKAHLGLDTHLSGIPEDGAGLHASAPAPNAGLDVTIPKPAFSADVGGAGLGTNVGGSVGLRGVGFGGGVGVGVPTPSAQVEVEGPVPKARMSRLLNKPDVSVGAGLNVKAPTLVRATSSNFLPEYEYLFSSSLSHLH